MAVQKVSQSFDLRDYHVEFLKNMKEKYKLPNEQKALRVLLDYAVGDGDLDKIFDRKNARCYACKS